MQQHVQREGYVLCWASALNDTVAFYLDDVDPATIPAGFVPYSESELRELFGDDKPDISLRLIHEAKKLGLNVVSNEPEGEPNGQP